MSKARVGVIIVVGVVILLFTVPLLMRIGQYAVIPHGYDGVVATTLEMEHNYDTESGGYSEYNTGLAMGFDPDATFHTGIRLSITSPQYVTSVDRVLDPITDIFTDDAGVMWNETTTQKASRMTFEMSMDLETYGNGFVKIEDVFFWIKLSNNDFSVFTGADDVAISIINVYNIERPYIAQDGAGIHFEPEASGADFPLHSIDGAEISNFPDWAADEYNLPNLQQLSAIKFPLYVLEAQPTTVAGIFDPTRVECQVEFKIGIDIILFGEWKELKPYRDVDWQEPDLTWWEALLAFLGGGLEMIFLIVFVLIGIIGTGIALAKMKRNAIPAVLVLWIGILFMLWMLGVF